MSGRFFSAVPEGCERLNLPVRTWKEGDDYPLPPIPFANPGEMERRTAEEDDDQSGVIVIALVVVAFIGFVAGFVIGIAFGGGLS